MDSLSYPKVGFGQCVIAMCCALSMTMRATSGGKRWCLGGEKTDPNKSELDSDHILLYAPLVGCNYS